MFYFGVYFYSYANLSDDSMEKVEYLRVLYDYVRTLAHFVVTCKGTESGLSSCSSLISILCFFP